MTILLLRLLDFSHITCATAIRVKLIFGESLDCFSETSQVTATVKRSIEKTNSAVRFMFHSDG